MIRKWLGESFAMLMIGDGVMCVVNPKRHSLFWQKGPQFWRNAMAVFADNPTMTRVFGVAEIALGVWLASGVEPDA